MSRLRTITGRWAAAVALLVLLGTGATAAPPAGGRTAPAAAVTADTDSAADSAATIAEIVALAEYLVDVLGLTFEDPLDELFFFFAVADFYFSYFPGGFGSAASAEPGRQ